MNRILVIGGTGNVGRQVVYQLGATGARFRAMTRNPDAAGWPPQVEVVRGDLTVPEMLDRCLEDIDTVFPAWVAPSIPRRARPKKRLSPSAAMGRERARM